MESTANILLFMVAGVGVGVGVVVWLRLPGPVLWAAAAAGIATALADWICAALGHRYDLWHLHGALSLLGVGVYRVAMRSQRPGARGSGPESPG